MMEERKTLQDICIKLSTRSLPRWEELPDLDLYMDQVLSLVHRYLGDDDAPDGKSLTSSMVNNYVKMHVMPAPEKKKYTRIHLAHLLMICVLKASLPISSIQEVLQKELENGSEEEMYNRFCDIYEKSGKDTAEAHRKGFDASDTTVVLWAALRAQSEQSLARQLSLPKAKDKKDK